MNKEQIIKITNKAVRLAITEIPKKMKRFDKDNFFVATKANYIKCKMPKGEADYTSRTGSKYYYSENGVVRVSDHWGYMIASCQWNLNNDYSEKEIKAGFCEWTQFKSNYDYKFEDDIVTSQRGKKPHVWN